MEAGLPGWVGLGRSRGSPMDKGFLASRLACSKALLQNYTFLIQLLGKQVNSLQGVPTALGVHERATCRDFDWERRERDEPKERGLRGWRSGGYTMAAGKRVER